MFARGLKVGHTRTRARRERGAVAVEFALIFPVLVMLLAGIVTAGMSYTNAIGLANGVREGARFGATADTASTTWAIDVVDRVRVTQSDPNSAAVTSVCVQLFKSDGTPGGGAASTVAGTSTCNVPAGAPSIAMTDAPAPPDHLLAGTCVVRVWAARKFEISLILFPVYRGTVLRTSLARYERAAC